MPGRDRDAQRALAFGASVAVTRVARRLDDLALAAAPRTGADIDHLAEHRLTDRADLAATIALRAGDRLGARLGAVAAARLAALQDGELDLLLGTVDGLLERDPQVVAQVGTGKRSPAPAEAAPAPPPKKASKMSEKPPNPSNPARAAGTAIDAGPPERVVARPPLGIGQDLVRLVDLLEALLGRRIGVDVRVPLLGQLAEGALDLGVGRCPLDAEDHVEVALCRGHGDERIREVVTRG